MRHFKIGESSKLTLKYYDCNVSGTLKLLKLMDEYGCHTFVFSSSATVHRGGNSMLLVESSTKYRHITLVTYIALIIDT